MQNWNRFPRLLLVVTVLIVLCAGLFAPKVEQVEARPLGAADELGVFISEFRTRGPNGADDEFVEIYNASGGAVNINNWVLRRSTSCGGVATGGPLVTINVTLGPGQYYLIGKSPEYTGSTPLDLSYSSTGIADDGGFALLNNAGVIIDQVGMCNTTAYKENSTLSPLSGTANQSYERKDGGSAGSCKDTDNNATDFIFNSSTSNPQNFASAAIPCLAVINATTTIASPATYLDTSGAVIDIQMAFSNIVTVTGSPTLLIETGSTDRTAVFAGGSGTNTLTFNYTIQPGDNTNDLDYAAYNALSLNGGSILGATGDATLILPKPGNPGSLSANEEIRIDNGAVSPALISFTRQTPTSQYTNADSLTYRITFSDAMLNVNAGDFIVNGVGGGPTINLTRVENGRMYDLTITGGNLANLNGMVELDLIVGHGITNVGGVSLPDAQPGTEQNYIADNLNPGLDFIRQAATQPDPTSLLPISFDISFSEAIDVSTFTTADIRQSGTATGITWSIANSGDNRNFVLTALSSGAGILAPTIDASRLRDLAGNDNNAFPSVVCPIVPAPNDNCVTFTDTVQPTVTINQTSTQLDPTSALPINFTVQFSEPINTATFTTADITQNGTATGTVWSITNSGNNMTFTLSVTASGFGTLVPSMTANRVIDLSGNNNTASTSTDNSVTYQINTATARAVIINEVAWAGTTSSLTDDEWIELYNPGSTAINITGWTLRAADGTPNITLNGTIPAGGYFLLERDNDSTVSDILADQVFTGDISNSGEAFTLRDGANNTIDTANGNGGAWPKGSSSTYGTMERIGTSAESDSAWLTNTGIKRNGKNANNGDILGTPKSSNSPLPTPTPTPDKTETPSPVPTFRPPDPRPIINEILPRPGFDWNQDGRVNVFDEFIEIKNLTSIDITLNGWKLDTVSGGSFSLPNVSLKPGERIVFYSLETNLLLSDGGETVRLIDASGKIYDAYTYTIAKVEDRSICRLPDGNVFNGWYDDCIPTPNLSNTREGTVPSMPGEGFESPVCQLPDTLPADFLFAECHGYGANIWNAYYWDQLGMQGSWHLPQNTSKWEAIIE